MELVILLNPANMEIPLDCGFPYQTSAAHAPVSRIFHHPPLPLVEDDPSLTAHEKY